MKLCRTDQPTNKSTKTEQPTKTGQPTNQQTWEFIKKVTLPSLALTVKRKQENKVINKKKPDNSQEKKKENSLSIKK